MSQLHSRRTITGDIGERHDGSHWKCFFAAGEIIWNPKRAFTQMMMNSKTKRAVPMRSRLLPHMSSAIAPLRNTEQIDCKARKIMITFRKNPPPPPTPFPLRRQDHSSSTSSLFPSPRLVRSLTVRVFHGSQLQKDIPTPPRERSQLLPPFSSHASISHSGAASLSGDGALWITSSLRTERVICKLIFVHSLH